MHAKSKLAVMHDMQTDCLQFCSGLFFFWCWFWRGGICTIFILGCARAGGWAAMLKWTHWWCYPWPLKFTLKNTTCAWCYSLSSAWSSTVTRCWRWVYRPTLWKFLDMLLDRNVDREGVSTVDHWPRTLR